MTNTRCSSHAIDHLSGRHLTLFKGVWMSRVLLGISLAGHGPSLNFEGSRMPAFCTQHTVDGMVNVNHTRRCLNTSCVRRLRWGLLSDGTTTVCPDILIDPVIKFAAECKVVGSGRGSWWDSVASSLLIPVTMPPSFTASSALPLRFEGS